jgi:hypothetical protein
MMADGRVPATPGVHNKTFRSDRVWQWLCSGWYPSKEAGSEEGADSERKRVIDL